MKEHRYKVLRSFFYQGNILFAPQMIARVRTLIGTLGEVLGEALGEGFTPISIQTLVLTLEVPPRQ